jgi:hypothetical protein
LSATAANHDSKYPLLSALAIALVVAALNIGLWWWGNLPNGPGDWHGKIGGFALRLPALPEPVQSRFPSDDQIDSDLKLLARYTDRIAPTRCRKPPGHATG